MTRNRIGRARRRVAVGLVCVASFAPGTVAAQQFVVDDAPIVDFRACQLEAWHGEQSSWALPACRFVRALELTAGIGSVRSENGRALEFVLQGKVLLRDPEERGVGVSVVAGAGVAPIRQPGGRRVTDVFAYVPATAILGEGRAQAHANLGWFAERRRREPGGGHAHHAAWGGRLDLAVMSRLEAIGELYGTDGEATGWQAGLRAHVIAERLLLDLSYGNHFDAGDPGPGFTVGVAWTPPPVR